MQGRVVAKREREKKNFSCLLAELSLPQAVLQGVPLRRVHVLRWKRLILLHAKGSGEPQQ